MRKTLAATACLSMLLFAGSILMPDDALSAQRPMKLGSPRSQAAMHILAKWLRHGIGEPEISNSKATVGKEGPRKQVCVRFWSVRGTAEHQIVLGVELGDKTSFFLPRPPDDCPNRRYSGFNELQAMLNLVVKEGENMRPFKPGARKIVLWRSSGF